MKCFFQSGDLMPLKAGRNISGHYDLNDVFFGNEEGEFVENLSVQNGLVETKTVRRGWWPLLHLTFRIYLVAMFFFFHSLKI